jgi:hypothetical protein
MIGVRISPFSARGKEDQICYRHCPCTAEVFIDLPSTLLSRHGEDLRIDLLIYLNLRIVDRNVITHVGRCRGVCHDKTKIGLFIVGKRACVGYIFSSNGGFYVQPSDVISIRVNKISEFGTIFIHQL